MHAKYTLKIYNFVSPGIKVGENINEYLRS